MVVLTSLRTAGRAVARNPILLVVAGLYGLIQVPGLLLRASGNVVLSLASSGYSLLTLLVAPFIVGGLVAMAHEATSGRTDWSTFVTAGRSNYLRLLAAVLLYVAASVVVGIVAAIVAIVVIVAGVAGGSAGSEIAVGIGLLVALVFGLVLLVVLLFVQFYPQAVVVEDYGVVGAFKRSAGLVRRHFAAALGYSVIMLAAGLVFGGLAALSSFSVVGSTSGVLQHVGVNGGAALAVAALGLVVYVALSGLVGGFLATYSVAFYEELAAADASE